MFEAEKKEYKVQGLREKVILIENPDNNWSVEPYALLYEKSKTILFGGLSTR